MEQRVECFGGGHVMRLGTNTAYAVGDVGHVLCWSAYAEALKSSQLGHLQIGVGDITLIGEENVDLSMALETSNGVNGYSFHDSLPPSLRPSRPPGRRVHCDEAGWPLD